MPIGFYFYERKVSKRASNEAAGQWAVSHESARLTRWYKAMWKRNMRKSMRHNWYGTANRGRCVCVCFFLFRVKYSSKAPGKHDSYCPLKVHSLKLLLGSAVLPLSTTSQDQTELKGLRSMVDPFITYLQQEKSIYSKFFRCSYWRYVQTRYRVQIWGGTLCNSNDSTVTDRSMSLSCYFST